MNETSLLDLVDTAPLQGVITSPLPKETAGYAVRAALLLTLPLLPEEEGPGLVGAQVLLMPLSAGLWCSSAEYLMTVTASWLYQDSTSFS